MPLNDSRAGITPGVSVMQYAQRISDADAQRIVDEFELSDRKEFQRQFDHWAIFYKSNLARFDNAPTPTAVKAKAKQIATLSAKLARELDSIDDKTRAALEMLHFDDKAFAEMASDIATLSQCGIVNLDEDPKVYGFFEFVPVAAGVRVLAHRAGELVRGIASTIKKNGRVKPHLFNASTALVMLVNNIRGYWESEGRPYTRSFDDLDEFADQPAAIPLNDASKFTTQIVSLIAPKVTANMVDRAMKDHIKTFGISKIGTGQKK